MHTGFELHCCACVIVNHSIAFEDDTRATFDWAMH